MKQSPDILFLPWPKQIARKEGVWAIETSLPFSVSSLASELVGVAGTTRAEIPVRLPLRHRTTEKQGFSFQLGPTPPLPPSLTGRARFALTVAQKGASAQARDYPSLVHAWMTLRQLFRQWGNRLPCMEIQDWPDIPWRVYHLDLKGTRRTFARLLALLPELAEWRINAILAEYEDHVILPSHPDIAAPEALTPKQIQTFVREAARFGITVIPLIQTLGHLQYLLTKPAYSHLREHPDDPAEACSTHPETWPLIRDFLDDMMALHPGMPFLHIGLDETFRVATCPRCVKYRGRKRPVDRFVEWARQIAEYVLSKGITPLMWSDVLARNLDLSLLQSLPKEIVFCGWGYVETGPLHYQLSRYRGGLVSREWFRRPEGRVDMSPPVPWTGGRWIEDLSEKERRLLEPFAQNRHYPRWVNSDFLQKLYRKLGLRHAVATGIRVSFHGPFHPRFITGQLNTLQGARACKQNNGFMLIGTSWSRGHSLAACNAHPDLDAYGLATLGTAGWSSFNETDLRAFDQRFAYHHFGLPDGELGDLLYMVERSSSRADHVHLQYLPPVLERLKVLRPKVKRHQEEFDLLHAVLEARLLQFQMQFSLLEMEYFHTRRADMPQAFRRRIMDDVCRLTKEASKRQKQLARLYSHSLLSRDAKELAETQLAFTRLSLESVFRHWLDVS